MRATGDRDRRPSPYPRPDNAPRRASVVRNKSARRRYLGAASAVVVAGVVTFGFLGGGSAAIAEGGKNEVVFTGECGALGVGLGNKSTPSTDRLTITEGEKVTFTNKLKNDAVLHIGNAESEVAKGESKTVKLTSNTEAKMSPKCSVVLKDHSEKTTVKVNPKQETGGDSDPGSGDGGGSGDNGGSTGGDNAGGGSDSGDNGSTAGGADKPGDSPDTGKKPKAEGNAGDPNKGDDAKDKADDEAAGADGSDDASSDGTAKVADANKVSTESSASALLAALAALCLAGVGFAALRTWISGRNAASA